MRMPEMTPAADEFLRGTRLAVIVEAGDPVPHAVPVWYRWDGEAIEFFTRRTRPKVERLRAQPAVAVLVSAEVAEPVYWVRIEGTAELSDDAAELVHELCDRYLDSADAGHRALGDELRAMADEAVRVRVVPERIFHFAG